MRRGISIVSKAAQLAVIAIGLAVGAAAIAQVQKSTTTTPGTPVNQMSVERGEVVYVSGNELVVRMEDGSMRHISNVPDTAKVIVDGKELGIRDLKPGMKLQRTITTTKTPQTITTVEAVTGTVWNVMAPSSVTLTLENGTNQTFKIPSGQKFTVDGREVDAFGLRKGMQITATRITEVPSESVSTTSRVTGTAPPPPPPANVPILVAEAQPAPPAQTQTAAMPTKLPKTGSDLALIGLLGGLCLVAAAGLRLMRA